MKELLSIDQVNRYDKSIFINTDSLNFKKLIELSNEKGFPTYKTTGSGLHFAEAILWHQRNKFPKNDMRKQILPLINEQIYYGNLDPRFLSHYYDLLYK